MKCTHRPKPGMWRAALVLGMFAASSVLAPGAARAGFLDFLFGGFQRQSAPQANAYAEPPSSTFSRGSENARGEGGGRSVVYCVRLCDGQHFPLEHMSNATPVETCRAMCPASKTKAFFGNAIDHAVARDGQRYTDLDSAYVYRDHLVANCTCNGKDAFGLAPFEAASDPTLRPGDIVATKDGFVAYTGGKRGQAATFTPVDASTLTAQLNQAPATSTKLTRHGEPEQAPPAPIEEEPGVVVQQPPDMEAYSRAQGFR